MKIDTRNYPHRDITPSQKDLQVDSILSQALLEVTQAAIARQNRRSSFPSCELHGADAEAMIAAEMQATYVQKGSRLIAA
jgi:hypothetical protein